MQSLEAELDRARSLDVADLADAVETIGFECTRCGACCKSEADDPHTATVFPDEVRRLQRAAGGGDADEHTDEDSDGATDGSGDADRGTDERDWRDVARPMPYGLTDGDDGPEGETFEWALATNACGDCTFYEEDEDGVGACTVHGDRPLVCETYPFSVALAGTSQPMGEAVDSVALDAQREAGEAAESDGSGESDEIDEPADGEVLVRAHECEGLGRDIDRADAEALAEALRERAVRELEEAIAVRDAYEPADPDPGEVVVHDSEGAKRGDGSPLDAE